MKNIILLSKACNKNKLLAFNKTFEQQNKKILIKTINVLDIKIIKNSLDNFFKTQNNFDSLVFTSKSGIEFFFKLLSKIKNKKQILDKKFYALGDNTYKQLEKHNLKSKNIINMNCVNAKDMGEKLSFVLKQSNQKKVSIIRAKKIITFISIILNKNNIKNEEFKIYKTSLKNITKTKKKYIDKNSVIIFSSPSTIKGFLKNYKWHSSYKAVAIGESTKKYLPKNIDFVVAKKPSINECIKSAIKILS
jgi:uroporphyrinogen-III synthase